MTWKAERVQQIRGTDNGTRVGLLCGRLVLCIALGLISSSSITTTSALAGKTHTVTATFGPEGTSGSATFSGVQGVAVDPSSEDVYVYDAAAGKVFKFDAGGEPLDFSPLSGNAIEGLGGGGNGESQIAVAPPGAPGGTQGDIYVANNAEVLVYAPNGSRLGQLTGGEACGVATDPAGHVFVGFYPDAVEYVPTANPVTNADQTATSTAEGLSACNVAADSAGNVYAAAYFGGVTKLEGIGAAAGTQLDPSASSIAVDPSTNDVYADRGSEIAVYDASGALLETYGSSQLSGSHGIAINSSTGNPASGSTYVGNGEAVLIYGPLVTLATVSTGEATEPTPGGSVTMHGSVNPEGIELTSCFFEYGTGTEPERTVPCAESVREIGAGEEPVAVQAQLTGLTPGRYRFRLRAANPGGIETGDDEAFAIPAAPVVSDESANASETSTDLRAQIDPGNAETTYHFEYGPTDSYGQSTASQTVPAGESAVGVSSHVTGLTPGATYHYRLVASNVAGPAVGPDQTFMTTPESNGQACPEQTLESPGYRSYLPECRAYELVSPSYTSGYAVKGGIRIPGFAVAASGERVAGVSLGAFAGQEYPFTVGENLGAPYAFNRSGTGWTAEGLTLPATRFPYANVDDYGNDLGSALFTVGDAAEPQASTELYIRGESGSAVRVGPLSPVFPYGQEVYLGASADLSRTAFSLAARSIAERNALWPGDSTLSSGVSGEILHSLYEYDGTDHSEPRLVGVENQEVLSGNGEARLISDCGTELGSGEERGDKYNAVSLSGFAIFFTAAAGPCSNETEVGTGPPVAELYARVEGSRTIGISEPSLLTPGRRCTGVCIDDQEEENGHQRSPGLFAGASADGRRVYFTTSQPLVDSDTDEGPDLYMAELGKGGLTRLVDVSTGGGGDPSPGAGADVQGVARVSEDGSRVYFVAGGVLTTAANANGEAAEGGAHNLYLYEPDSDHIAFVTRLGAGDSQDWSREDFRPVQTSDPEGRFLVFTSEARPRGTGDTSSAAQLFEYDASTGSVVRVSVGEQNDYLCPQTGELEVGYNCNGNVASDRWAPSIQSKLYYFTDHAITRYQEVDVTTDGTVFFQSKDALTPQAANGYPNSSQGFNNVYEYHRGDVYLISDGREGPSGEEGGEPYGVTRLVGSSADGGAVLFLTADPLVPSDGDTQSSLYEARADGGFPTPSPSPSCQGQECRGTPSTSGASVTPGSARLQGTGNLKPTRRKCRKGERRSHGTCVKTNRRRHGRKGKHKRRAVRQATNHRRGRSQRSHGKGETE